jgi:hypothetical protein
MSLVRVEYQCDGFGTQHHAVVRGQAVPEYLAAVDEGAVLAAFVHHIKIASFFLDAGVVARNTRIEQGQIFTGTPSDGEW